MLRFPLGRPFLCCFAAVAVAMVVLAPPAMAEDASSPRPSMTAMAVDGPPTVDGDVLGDPVWADVPPATGFFQTSPFAGQAASEKTEVRIAFTEDTLYIGLMAYDREPDAIIVSDARRDASLNDGDSFQVIFDTFEDGQNGFLFGTNPAGIEYDGQVVRGGSGAFGSLGGGGRFRGGAGGGFNLNWDGDWLVAAQQSADGWSAEMAIPFSTLRYPPGRVQSWGINFQRNIRRRNETAFWAPLDRQMSIDRLTEAGTISGLEVPPQRNLQLIPYALGTVRQDPAEARGESDDAEVGIDAKWGITPSLTLDATINTDFAQVEVDEQQVNLDRFNLFFPEKRPFFLENAGLFAVGSSGEVDLFFSRRIGLGPAGQQIPIAGGLRLSGRVGRTSVGVLGMRTDSLRAKGDNAAVQANAFGVARVSRDLPNRSNIGVIAISRDGSGSFSPAGDSNRTYGLDFQAGIGEYHTLRGFVAQTDTPGLDGDDHAFQLNYSHASPKWRGFLDYTETGDAFNPEVGFLSRSAFHKGSGFVMRTIRPKDRWGLQELRPHVSYTGYWDYLDDEQESEFIHVDNHWEWRSGMEIHTGINFTYEGVRETFEIAPDVFVPAGEYSHDEAQIVFFTNQGAPYSYSNRITIGGFFGGDRVSMSNTVALRWGEQLTSQLTWRHDNVNLPLGDFEINLGRARVSFAITPRMLVQTLVQYNDVTDAISTNLRFSWLQGANTGLFVVYNEIDEFGRGRQFLRPDRSLIIKYSHLIDVFGGR